MKRIMIKHGLEWEELRFVKKSFYENSDKFNEENEYSEEKLINMMTDDLLEKNIFHSFPETYMIAYDFVKVRNKLGPDDELPSTWE